MSKTKNCSKIVVRNAFTVRDPVRLVCPSDEGKTQQSFKEECDINSIVLRFTKTGLWANSLVPGSAVPMFGDFTNVCDFTESMNRLAQASEDFDRLPSGLRKRFSNDPAQLLDFIFNPSNRDEAVKLGLLRPAPGPAAGSAAVPSAGDKAP